MRFITLAVLALFIAAPVQAAWIGKDKPVSPPGKTVCDGGCTKGKLNKAPK